MRISATIRYLFFIVILAAATALPQSAVKAKIGVLTKSNNKISKLKTFDRLKPGDELRVCILPADNLFFYAIFSDQKTSTLLNFKQAFRLTKNKSYLLPSASEFYQLDENSAKVKLTLICCAKKVDKIESIFKSADEIPVGTWAEAEKAIIAASKKDISDNSDKPFTMAGNVRGINDDFFDKLTPLTAEKTLIRIFEIEVKK